MAQRKQWFLKCGSDIIGTVIWNTSENWHNYGHLEPGPNYELYREPLEQAWEAYQRWETLFYSDDVIPDEDLQQAEDRREKTEQTLEQFTFYFEDTVTNTARPIHDFHIDGDNRTVYWRWGKIPDTISK